MNYLKLVNKENKLSKTYRPQNLIIIEDICGRHLNKNYKNRLEKTAYQAFLTMQKEALNNNLHIIVDSSYRSYAYQQKLLNNYIKKDGVDAYNYVALPGTSEHQTGLAIDIGIVREGKHVDNFDDTFEEIKWLHDNAHKYGFILRYPKGKENITKYVYEPWHIRYVGPISEQIYKENLTLEEYYSKYL